MAFKSRLKCLFFKTYFLHFICNIFAFCAQHYNKLLKRFLELDHDIRFEEIVKVMKEYGYEIKQPKGGSSHYSFVKPGCSRIVIPKHKPIKKVYVKMIKKVIEEEMKEYESRTQILHESIVSYGNC